MRRCNCLACTFWREMELPSEEEMAERRHEIERSPQRVAMVMHYMRRFGLSEPEASAALEREDRSMWDAAVAAAAESHGLDDDDAAIWVLVHGSNMPRTMQ